MKALSWIDFILGIWLFVAAFAISTGARPVMTEEIVLGIIIAALAALSVVKSISTINWIEAFAGLWTLIAPAIIGYVGMTASRINDIVVGIVVLILSVGNALYQQSPVNTHA